MSTNGKKKTSKVAPRKTPDRDEWYMGLAFWIAAKSKDPDTQAGAVIVGENNKILGTGYNGPPGNFDDNELDWSRASKHDDMIHAEENAIARAFHSNVPAVIYITAVPCNGCMLRICQAAACGDVNIRKVVYYPFPTRPGSSIGKDFDKVQEKAKRAKIDLVEFKGNLNWMRDRMAFMQELGIF